METNATKRTDIYQIDPRNIVVVDGFNARTDFDLAELKGQIKAQGVLNPISVIPIKDAEGNEKYRLVDGERRYRSVMELIREGEDIKRIKAMFLPRGTKEEDMYIQQALRNEGKNFSPMEWGRLFSMFIEKFGYIQAEVAEKFGKKASFVSACLSLLDIAPEIQESISKGDISAETAKKIISQNKDDEQAQISAVKDAITKAKESGKKKATNKFVETPTSKQIADLLTKVEKDLTKVYGLCGKDGENDLYKQIAEFISGSVMDGVKAYAEKAKSMGIEGIKKSAA